MTASQPFKVRKLLAQSNCPACGAALDVATGTYDGTCAAVANRCSSEFMVDSNGAIIASQPCPSAAHVAAQYLHKEAAHEAAEAGAE